MLVYVGSSEYCVGDPLLSCYSRSRDARRSNQNSGAQGPRLKFYSVYDREAKVFDYKFADDCQTDLSDVLIFVRYISSSRSLVVRSDSSVNWARLVCSQLSTRSSQSRPHSMQRGIQA